ARVGPYPVRFLANIPGAKQMRLGNTLNELKFSEWRDYAAESLWFVRTGEGTRVVFAEFRGPDLEYKTSALVPPYDEAKGTDYEFPLTPSNKYDPFDDGHLIWSQNFSVWSGRWASYDLSGGPFDLKHNVFYPVSWASTGGSDGGGYIWTDNSRWRIDTPE